MTRLRTTSRTTAMLATTGLLLGVAGPLTATATAGATAGAASAPAAAAHTRSAQDRTASSTAPLARAARNAAAGPRKGRKSRNPAKGSRVNNRRFSVDMFWANDDGTTQAFNLVTHRKYIGHTVLMQRRNLTAGTGWQTVDRRKVGKLVMLKVEGHATVKADMRRAKVGKYRFRAILLRGKHNLRTPKHTSYVTRSLELDAFVPASELQRLPGAGAPKRPGLVSTLTSAQPSDERTIDLKGECFSANVLTMRQSGATGDATVQFVGDGRVLRTQSASTPIGPDWTLVLTGVKKLSVQVSGATASPLTVGVALLNISCTKLPH